MFRYRCNTAWLVFVNYADMFTSNLFLFLPVPNPTFTHKLFLQNPPYNFQFADVPTQSLRKPPVGRKIWTSASPFILHHGHLVFHHSKTWALEEGVLLYICHRTNSNPVESSILLGQTPTGLCTRRNCNWTLCYDKLQFTLYEYNSLGETAVGLCTWTDSKSLDVSTADWVTMWRTLF